ncbi:MAG: hypothetical protein FWD42_01040 [Solirubrobacterales bacterium]|nr:hypothetical protein [Solirubrobacterales bacterium]
MISPANSAGERTSTSLVSLSTAPSTSSRRALIASSAGFAVNPSGSWPGASVEVGRPSAIHFSRGPFSRSTFSWP